MSTMNFLFLLHFVLTCLTSVQLPQCTRWKALHTPSAVHVVPHVGENVATSIPFHTQMFPNQTSGERKSQTSDVNGLPLLVD